MSDELDSVQEQEEAVQAAADSGKIGPDAQGGAARPQAEPASGEQDSAEQSADDSAQSGESAGADDEQVAELTAKVADLEEQLARQRADTYNVSQEYANFVRRSKAEGEARKQDGIESVVDTLLSVLDDIELARQHGDLDGPGGAIALKLENKLEVNFKLVRYGAEGDPFDPEIHEALMHNESEDVESEQIGTLIQPGYKLGDKVVRPARVGVVSPA
ncbi:MAG: nucleotide exchange factor GrpE [Flaviflexus sp.]|nr:nucleotide exchange factor GrpE [Flaviflexus sp.]